MERKRKKEENIAAVVRSAWYLGACSYCSEAWNLFCVWWWFPVLECLGLSAVRWQGGRGFYGQWVLKIVFGCTVWFSFKWLFAANSVWI